MRFFTARLSTKLCALGLVLAAQSVGAHEVLPTQAEAFGLMMQLSEVDISDVASCQAVAETNQTTLKEILGHYLSVLSESENIKISAQSASVSGTVEMKINFAVIDDESPWQYGFQFSASRHAQSWKAEPASLICTGL